jgi:relaxase-like protein
MANRAYNDELFSLVSHARRGPGRRDYLSPGQIAQVTCTVRRTPEVMIKVLSHGGQDQKAVGRHLDYLRLREEGEQQIETDDGERLTGRTVSYKLLEDWDLDLEEHRHRSDLDARGGGSTKLVHKVIFSMPEGTPAQKVLAAVKNFAREEFALKHRYAMVLHTDEAHPHVHMVLKAVSEQGERLHIRKATLREWRRGFAWHLRNLGVEANATERAVRGVTVPRKLDGIYRPMNDPKRFSTHMMRRAELIGSEIRDGGLKIEPGKAKLVASRAAVEQGWRDVSDILIRQGHPELASEVRRFAEQMEPPRTDKEWLAVQRHMRDQQPVVKDRPVSR